MTRWHQDLSTILLAVLLSLSAVPLQTQAQEEPSIILGEDQLNPIKWAQPNAVREIVDGGWVTDITTRSSDKRLARTMDLPDADPKQPKSFSADVSVIEVNTLPKVVRARALIQGRFYKDTAKPKRVGEIVGNMDIRTTSNGTGLEVWASVHRCNDSGCQTAETLDQKILGKASLGQRYRLWMGFDGKRTFTFKLDDGEPVTMAAPVVVAAPDKIQMYYGASIKGIDPTADPVEEALIKSRVDNLAYNDEIKRDFDDLTSNELRHNTEVRKVENGKAVLKRFFWIDPTREKKNINPRDNTLSLLEPTIINNSVSADVTIKDLELEGELKKEGKKIEGSVALAKRWYQSEPYKSESTGEPVPGSGDVVSQIRIVHDAADGKINDGNVKLLVGRCKNAACGGTVNLNNEKNVEKVCCDEKKFGPVKLNTVHRLSMEWNGTAISFKFDEQTETYPVTDDFPMENPLPFILSEPFLVSAIVGPFDQANQWGAITAHIDDVRIIKGGDLFDDFSALEEPTDRRLQGSGRNTANIGNKNVVEPDHERDMN